MRWRTRFLTFGASVVLMSALNAASPYWHSVVSPADSFKGRTGRRDRAEDTPARVAERAAVGALLGAGLGLLLFIDGLEFRKRRPQKPDGPPSSRAGRRKRNRPGPENRDGPP